MEGDETKLEDEEELIKEPEFLLEKKHMASFEEFKKKVLAKIEEKYNLKRLKYGDETHLKAVFTAQEAKIDKAYNSWEEWVNWRLKYEGEFSISIDSIKSELDCKKAYFHKYDKEKHPCLVMKIKNNLSGSCSTYERMRFLMYIIDLGCEKARKLGKEKFCIIWDREGFSKEKNFDEKFSKEFKEYRHIIESNYLERVDCIYILQVEFFFRMMYNLAKPFLKKKTRKRFKLIGKDPKKELLKYFDSDCLMKEYGGTSNFEIKDVIYE